MGPKGGRLSSLVRNGGVTWTLCGIAVAALIAGCGNASGSGSNAAVSSPSTDPCPTQVPATFPEDFPVYPGATFLSDQNCAGWSDGPSGSVLLDRHWSTSDSAQKVIAFYSAKLAGNWSVSRVTQPDADGAGGAVHFTWKSDPYSRDDEVDYAPYSPGEIWVYIWTQQSSATAASTKPSTAPVAPSPAASPTSAQTVGVAFVNAPLTVAHGQNATLQVKTAPNTSCSIEVDYKSGPSTAAGLVPKTSDGAGNVSWTWKVGANTTLGAWPITVTCGSASAQTQINVT